MKPSREIIYLNKGQEKQIKKGFPWIYREQISNISTLMLMEPGEEVFLAEAGGSIIATGYANPKAQISIRLLEFKKYEGAFDAKYFAYKIGNALKRREKHYSEPFYRMVFSESDFLPGLVIDRFADTFSIQISTAGMDRLFAAMLEGLESLLKPKNIILRNDIPIRSKEGLTGFTKVIKGEIPELLQVQENGFTYLADLQLGQKTGWFYDMRENRKMIAEYALANNCQTILDSFCYTGGFGLLAAKAGLKPTLLDSSARALDIARKTAELNSLQDIEYIQSDVSEALTELHVQRRKFDIIILDPPPYAKQKDDRFAAENGYKKLVKQALPLIADNGVIFLASCSYNAPMQMLKKSFINALKFTDYKMEVLFQTHASPDHPVLSILPQTNYLSAVTIKLHQDA